MNLKLAIFSSRLWAIGFAGMLVSTAGFDLGPGHLSFDLFARTWIVGGLTYLFMASLIVLGARGDARAEA
jgi:hypothetical protein